jgi:general secretion pathway protein G
LTPRRQPVPLPADAGMTILELLIVLVILSLIGTVVGVQIAGQLDRAKVDVAKLQLRQLQNALTLFELDTRRFPTGEEGLGVLLSAPHDEAGWRGPYLKNAGLLADPWGRPVTYSRDEAGHYLLASVGADGKAGGEGAAADIQLGETQ